MWPRGIIRDNAQSNTWKILDHRKNNLICWLRYWASEIPYQKMLCKHSSRLEHGTIFVESNTLVKPTKTCWKYFTFNSFKMQSFLCFLFASTAFSQKTSSFPISSSTSQSWSPTKNSTQINCARGEPRSALKCNIIMHLVTGSDGNNTCKLFSQEFICFLKRSQRKHRNPGETKWLFPN